MIYCTVDGYRERVTQVRKEGAPKFFKFFDGGNTPDLAFAKAEDVFTRMMLPWVPWPLWAKKKGTSLDLGYGGGGQVLAARKHFTYVFGLDVHNEGMYVCNELRRRGASRFILIRGDGSKIYHICDNHIDFVHSWVTLMHVGTINIVKKYLKEIYRVMKPGGIAVLFFSRLLNTGTDFSDWKNDIEKEGTYREKAGRRVNQINLQIGMKFFEALCKDAGFILVNRTVSHSPTGVCGGQHGAIIRK